MLVGKLAYTCFEFVYYKAITFNAFGLDLYSENEAYTASNQVGRVSESFIRLIEFLHAG